MKQLTYQIITILFSLTIYSCKNLRDDEIAKLDHTYTGCFGAGTNVLTIYRDSGIVYAALKMENNPVKRVKLSGEQFQAFNSFATALRQLNQQGGCTTVEKYVLKTRDETIEKTDGSCQWSGFYNLTQTLFGNVEL